MGNAHASEAEIHPMDIEAVVEPLVREARATNERRLLVLAGEREATYGAAERAFDALAVDPADASLVGRRDFLPCERLSPKRADALLGSTREAVFLDCRDELRPNTLGRVAGAVDGGGLLVLLAPALDSWPDSRDGFDETLAVPPFDVADVTGHFRRRLVSLLRAHPGIAIVNADPGTVERSGLTHPAPRIRPPEPEPPADRAFPAAAYDACLTADQMNVVRDLEALREGGNAVVVEADRGRGKSSAAGIAAACLAAEGLDVLVTAPGFRGAREVFVRARALLDTLGIPLETDEAKHVAAADGSIRFEKPADAGPGRADAVLVDEAAALPVGVLSRFLAAERVAFLTTVHGYEGAGRGFSVRFRDRLAESDLRVTESTLLEPIRYAAGDPVETWAFRALLLDARPAVDPLVAGVTPDETVYHRLSAGDLLADEPLLREVFGLLVLAHYRTEPNDLARLLDAPNLSMRALLFGGHVVAVALLAREGDLPADLREHMYEGGRVRGNMLPDVLTSQLRDEDAATPSGTRVMRIATHHAVRSRGLGSRLLSEIRDEFANLDWLGVGYGATPELLAFWRTNGYHTVHLSTTRNDTSGEHSAIMMDPLSDAGRDLYERTSERFVRRIPSMLSDALSDLDADVVRAALSAADAPVSPDLTDWEWRLVAASAFGPGMMDVSPRPFRELALAHFVDGATDLSVREERLLVRRVLQAHDWRTVADELGFHSAGQCMRALGDAFEPLVDHYGNEAARAEKRRYVDGGADES